MSCDFSEKERREAATTRVAAGILESEPKCRSARLGVQVRCALYDSVPRPRTSVRFNGTTRVREEYE